MLKLCFFKGSFECKSHHFWPVRSRHGQINLKRFCIFFKKQQTHVNNKLKDTNTTVCHVETTFIHKRRAKALQSHSEQPEKDATMKRQHEKKTKKQQEGWMKAEAELEIHPFPQRACRSALHFSIINVLLRTTAGI